MYKHDGEKEDGDDGSDGDGDIDSDEGDDQGDSRKFCVHGRR